MRGSHFGKSINKKNALWEILPKRVNQHDAPVNNPAPGITPGLQRPRTAAIKKKILCENDLK
jgi:hypothetical protein